MEALLRSTLLFILFVSGCGGALTVKESAVEPPPPKPAWGPETDRLDPAVAPVHYRVGLELDPAVEAYQGEVQIEVRLAEPKKTLWLHSEDHEIDSLEVQHEGKPVVGATHTREKPDWLGIQLPEALGAGRVVLSLRFHGKMKTPLFGLYRTQYEKDWYIFTQFEAIDARKAFPCFDEPGFKTPYEISLTVPTGLGAFTNAPLVRTEAAGEGRTRHIYAPTPPMPSYLVALTVGPLDVAHAPEHDLVRPDGTRLPIRILTAKGRGGEAMLALRETRKILSLEEAYFGTPYPYAKLDLVAVPDFAAGAMENPGLVTYRDRLLLMDEATVTDDELRSYAGIHAHELAHMWFGDLVTMSWWDDLWLNEAFATWLSRKIVGQYRPDWEVGFDAIAGRTRVMDQDSTTVSRRIRERIKARGDIENAFDGITYAKGAAVLDTFERYVGEEAFRDGVRTYLKAHSWKNATYADLLGAIETASGKKGLGIAMDTFLDQAGVPFVHFEPGQCDEQGQTITLRQSRWRPLGGDALAAGEWKIPVCIKGVDTGASVCGVLDGPEGTLKLPGCAEILMPNPDVGGYMVWSLPEAKLVALSGRLEQLTELDQVGLLANLSRLYASGDLDPTVIAAMTPRLLESKSDRVRNAALVLGGGLGALVEDSDIPAWDRYRNSLVGKLLKALRWKGKGKGKEPRPRWRLRRAVLAIAGNSGHRRKVIAKARRVTKAFLRGKPVVRETLRTALSIDAWHGDEAHFDTILKAFLAETDSTRRSALLGALGSFRFDGFPERSFAVAFDERLRVNERGRFIWATSGYHAHRAEAWTWLKANKERVRKLLPRNHARYMPYFPVRACQPELAAELTAVFGPWTQGDDAVEGIERHLATAQDQVKQCLARRQRYGAAIKKVLAPFQKK